MLYELRIDCESDQDLADVLARFVDAIRGLPSSGNIFSFTRYRDQDHGNGAINQPMRVSGAAGGGLPLTQEAYDAAAKASAATPAKRGRPPKATVPTATIVDGPDGEPAAAMEESPFGNAPEPDAATPLTPAQKRDKSIAILQSVFAHPAGPPGVRSLQTKLKVKKFNEVPDAEVDTLLSAAEQLYARIQATPGAAA